MAASVAVIAALVVAPAQARAQGAAAQSLYDKAADLLDQKKYAEACPMLEEVVKLVPDGLGAKLTLAECYEGQGRLASAWSQYAMVDAAASRLGQADRQKKAAERAAALKPKLSTVTLQVPSELKSIPGLVIKQDGVVVGTVLWNEPQPVDVGSHAFVVEAPGRKSFEKSLEVIADGAALEVALPETLEPVPGAAGPGAGSAGGDAGGERPWQLPTAIAVASVGGAALIIGAGIGGLAMSRTSESEGPGLCDDTNRCTEAGAVLRNDAIVAANASTGLLISGAILAAGATVLFITLPSDDGAAKTPEAPPKPERSITFAPGWVGVRGTF